MVMNNINLILILPTNAKWFHIHVAIQFPFMILSIQLHLQVQIERKIYKSYALIQGLYENS